MSTASDPTPAAVVACPACGRRNRVPNVAGGTPQCAVCHSPLPWLVEADDDSFAAMTAGALPVLVDFWAPWCGPCRMVSPAVEEAARRLAGRLKALKVNVDEAPGTARRFDVQGVPTLLILRAGREVGRQVGALPAAALQQWITRQLEATPA
jgi:thioredoxin 2